MTEHCTIHAAEASVDDELLAHELDAHKLVHECGGRCDDEAPAPDSVTILVCARDRRAAKRWSIVDGAPTLEGYDAGRLFRTAQAEVASLADLAELLERLASTPSAYVIRGEPRVGVLGTIGRRLSHDDPRTGDAARYDEVPRRWVAHDLDQVALPRAYDLRDPDEAREALERLRRMLSAEWRRAACVAQLTASAGHGDPRRLSARLWYWLDRPVGRAALEAWARATRAPVDTAIYRAVQPHYTAAPVYVAPLRDPIPQRTFVLDGDPVVWLPDYAPPEERRPERLEYAPPPRDENDGARRRYARATLERLAHELAAAGEGTRHATLFAAARRAGGLVRGGWLAHHEVVRELSRAARAAGLVGAREREVARTIDDGIRCGAERWPWDPPLPEVRP